MAENSKIEWLDGGHTASPWHGCSEVHAGCDFCYARTMAKRNPGTLGVWGKDGTRVMSASFAKNCRRWNKSAQERGVIETVFPSICDPFEAWDGAILDAKGERYSVYKPNGGVLTSAPYMEEPLANCRWLTMDDLRRALFALIDECQSLRFLLLTKRPENIKRMWTGVWSGPDFPGDTRNSDGQTFSLYRSNVWLLTSVSDQATADAMIPDLLKCRDLVPVLGLSMEPLLGPVDLTQLPAPAELQSSPNAGLCYNALMSDDGRYYEPPGYLDWVILGGESGHGARPYNLAWPRSIIAQCRAAGVPVFHKQLGKSPIDHEYFAKASAWFKNHWGFPPGLPNQIEECTFKVKDPKGGNWDEWPADLRVREYPKVPHA